VVHCRPGPVENRNPLVCTDHTNGTAHALTRLARLFTFAVLAGSLSILFLAIILALAARRMLIPGIILLGSFVLFVLWVTVLIETAIQLYGDGNVNSNCNNFVQNQEFHGVSIETLAWLTQSNICSCWKASFAWSIILAVLFLWMMILSWQVQNYDD
jgi:hypothetical protein